MHVIVLKKNIQTYRNCGSHCDAKTLHEITQKKQQNHLVMI